MKANRVALSLVVFAALFSTIPVATCQDGRGAPRMDFSLMGGAAKVSDNAGSAFPLANGLSVRAVTNSPVSSVWQANFGWRIFHAGPVSTYFEVPLTHVPSQTVNAFASLSAGPAAFPESTTDSAWFFTPGFRVRLLNKAISPYAVAGAGIERATFVHEGLANLSTALAPNNGLPTRNYKGVFDFGGGADVKLTRFFALRAELRDFVRTGQTTSDSPITGGVLQQVTKSRQTLTFLGGIVVRF